MLLLSVFLLFLTSTDAFMWPKVCLQKGWGNVLPKPCCPYFSGSECGYDLGRGYCAPVPTSRPSNPAEYHNIDDRDEPPSYYFTHRCVCNGFYAGPECGSCKFNRYGQYCENLRPIYRVEVTKLTVAERIKYLANLHYCKLQIDPRYYIMRATNRFDPSTYEMVDASYLDVTCYMHYYVTKRFFNRGREYPFLNYAHEGCVFLSWHRFYLYYMENQIQRCLDDVTFGLSFYNWQDDINCKICNDEMLGSTSEYGYLSGKTVFSSWRVSTTAIHVMLTRSSPLGVTTAIPVVFGQVPPYNTVQIQEQVKHGSFSLEPAPTLVMHRMQLQYHTQAVLKGGAVTDRTQP
ncbi:tyrosinase-like [Leptodactylus fuscus]|uniref:tyrosinase-like n=1 Tax=Leptodactylus fuscus TaxID=238119 RepID=UPI003F4EB179